jgi:hypothetical protein
MMSAVTPLAEGVCDDAGARSLAGKFDGGAIKLRLIDASDNKEGARFEG